MRIQNGCFLFVAIAVLANNPVLGQGLLKQLEDQLFPKSATQQTAPDPAIDPTAELLPRPKVDSDSAPSIWPGFPSRPASPSSSSAPPPPLPAPPLSAPSSPFLIPSSLDRNAPTIPGSAGGYLGLSAERSIGGGLGLLVVDVTEGSPAWKAGFQVGDRILAVAGHAVSDLNSLAARLSEQPTNEAVRFLVNRNGRNREVVAVLQDRNLASRIQNNLPEAPSMTLTPNLSAAPTSTDFIRMQNELLQTQQQLSESLARIRELENRLRQLESNRRGFQ